MKTTVLFIHDHVVEHPATVLQRTETSHIADIPASVTRWNKGQTTVFSSKKDALVFVKGMCGAAILVQT